MESIIEDAHHCRNIVKSLLAYSASQRQSGILDLNELVEQSLS